MTENLNVSGIYVIKNTANGKVYVGSAVNVRRRWTEHRRTLRLGSHHSPTMQRAWIKHGEQCFDFSIIETVEDRGLLIEREQAWMDRENPSDPTIGYNINPKADSRMGTKWTAERKAEFSASRKGFQLGKKLSPAHLEALVAGRKAAGVSNETKKKMSEAARARVRRPTSVETKKKIGDANRRRKHLPVAESTRQKLSLAAKADWQKRKTSMATIRSISHG